jgi:hypothetical protein
MFSPDCEFITPSPFCRVHTKATPDRRSRGSTIDFCLAPDEIPALPLR